MSRFPVSLAVAGSLIAGCVARAADWPMWRGNAGRTAVTAEPLSGRLHLQWVLRLPPQSIAWKDEESMQFDRGYRPIVAGKRMFVASTRNDSLTAYDLQTGAELWRLYAEGPIRVAPAAYGQNVYAASDDGCLYCLAAADGRIRWRFRGGPSDRRVMGNERLISTWPARGGPVVAEGTVYFAVGVWPFMGTFVHALEPETGRVVWTNDSTGCTWERLPHPGAYSFSGLSPQGHLACSGDRLIVPGSRFQPAVFDRRTGEFRCYGDAYGPEVAMRGRYAFAGGAAFETERGREVNFGAKVRWNRPVLAPDAWHTAAGTFKPASIKATETAVAVPEGEDKEGPSWSRTLFEGSIRSLGNVPGTPWLRAGRQLVVSSARPAGRDSGSKARRRKPGKTPAAEEGTSVGAFIQLYDLGGRPAAPELVWQHAVEGALSDVLAADGRLIVVTLEGRIYCFGPDPVGQVSNASTAGQVSDPSQAAEVSSLSKAAQASSLSVTGSQLVLRRASGADGYCVVFGLGDGGLIEALVAQTRLHVIAIDPDAAKVAALRRRLDAAGVYGTRAAAIVGDVLTTSLPPYLASLIVVEDPRAAGFGRDASFVQRLFAPLRPYGGVACVRVPAEHHADFVRDATQGKLAGAEVTRDGDWTLLGRPGPLPGSAPWLGQNADAASTRCSRDRLVMAPLGVLWFGNALSNSLILPRHGEGPVEQVAGGRLFIEGPECLSAADVYTGRLLWTREFAKLGRYYDVTKHQPGAHSIGSNFFVAPDAVYLSAGEACHVLDPATGETLRQLQLPLRPGESRPSEWQFLLVYEDLLIAGSHPIIDQEQQPGKIYSPTSSQRLVVMERRSGRVLWTRDAAESFRHYGICAGGGKVFCIDRTATETLKQAGRRGIEVEESPRILALDARTGALVWHDAEHAGEGLSYSAEHDIVLSDAALRGKDGSLVWQNRAAAKAIGEGKWGCMLHGDTILCQTAGAYDLLSGKQRTVCDAGGSEVPWRYPRAKGCSPKAASEHLITFRSGAAAFCDLKNGGGTGHLGGFRAGCTSNLIVADGVLNAPDYTRTCKCPYENRSSLALVHDPDVEYWTYGAVAGPGRLAFNFGAPGDRKTADGTLWQATPCIASTRMTARHLVRVAPRTAEWFYHHTSRIRGGDGLPWVGASGVVGLRSARVPLEGIDTGKPMTVRLVFVEPEHDAAGKRVFSVAIDGKEVVRDLDVAAGAGGPWRTLVRELRGVEYAGQQIDGGAALEFTFVPRAGEPLICGIEVVEAK